MNELIMLVGLPASGKSTWAKEYIKENPEYVIHSSDELRREMYGSVYENADNSKVFEELHRRIRKDLETHSVIYDATNLVKKRRVAFLHQLGKHVYKKCILFLKPYEKCVVDNLKREDKVPEYTIERMRKVFSPPMHHEGFNEILVVQDEIKDLNTLINKTKDFDQENSHHTLSLFEHLKKASEEVPSDNSSVWLAASCHDIGKLFTKTRLNSRGEDDGNCHYYQHHSVGAYEFLTACDFSGKVKGKDVFDVLYVANLIYYHMHPYLQWKQSRKAMKKDKLLIGHRMFSDVMLLHEADVKSH